jgi:hypothetical protein
MKNIILFSCMLFTTVSFTQEHKKITHKLNIGKAERMGNKNGWVYSNLTSELIVQQLQDDPSTYKRTSKLKLNYTVDGYRFNGKLYQLNQSPLKNEQHLGYVKIKYVLSTGNTFEETYGSFGVTHNIDRGYKELKNLSNIKLQSVKIIEFENSHMEYVLNNFIKTKQKQQTKTEYKTKQKNELEENKNDDSSNSYDYSNNKNSSDSDNNNNSYSSSNTSYKRSYQKKQREATDMWNAQKKINDKAKRDYYAQVNKKKQYYDQLNKGAIDGINKIAGMVSKLQQQKARNNAIKAQYAREQAQNAEIREMEEKAEKRLERIKARMKFEEKERIKNAQSSFLDKIKDHNISVLANKKELFFIIITISEKENKIEISPFSLFANNDNLLPYKIDVISDFKKKTGKSEVFMQGPFNTFEEQKKDVEDFQMNAKNSYVSYSLTKYSYLSRYNRRNTQNTDFWGEKKKSTKKKKTKTKSIWN